VNQAKISLKMLLNLIGLLALIPFFLALLDSVRSNSPHLRKDPEPSDGDWQLKPYFEPFSSCTEPTIVTFFSITIFANYFADTVISNTPYEGAPESYAI
jgi:hypothetical protein